MQFGWLMFQNARMAHVARDAARQISVQQTSPEAAQASIPALLGEAFAATVDFVPLAGGRNTVVVTISVPMEKAAVIPFFLSKFGSNLVASASMTDESI